MSLLPRYSSASSRSCELLNCPLPIAFARHRASYWPRSSLLRCASRSRSRVHRFSIQRDGRSQHPAAVAAIRSCDPATPRSEAAATRHRGTGRVMGVRELFSSPFKLPSRGPGALMPEIEQGARQTLSPCDRTRARWPELFAGVEEETRPLRSRDHATSCVEWTCVECRSHVARPVSSFSATPSRSAIR